MPFVFKPDFGSGPSGNVATIDSGIIAKLRDSGYNINAISIEVSALIRTAQPTRAQLLPGAFVPVYQTSDGMMYVIDENSRVYLISRIGGDGGTPSPSPSPTPTPSFPAPTNGGGIPNSPGGPGIPPPIPPSFPPTPPITPTPLPGSSGGLLGSGKIYTTFDVGDIVPNQQATITKAMWTGNVGNLLTHYTSSRETTTQKRYYYEVFNSASSNVSCVSEAQYSVLYGHKNGSGSADEGGQVNDTPSKAIYGQYRLLCLEPSEQRFIINGSATDHIYVINVNRSRFRERIDEGNFELNLHHLSGSEWLNGGKTVNSHTGSNVSLGAPRALRLIDDSKINSATVTSAGEVYNIVSGSIENGVYNSSRPQKFGLLYPRLGIAVLDANLLDISASFLTVTGSEVSGDNAFKLFKSISGSGANLTDLSGDRLGFQARSSEKVKSTHFFIRVKNGEYNFSNNPTFTTGSEGDLAEATFIGDPQVYITTVGLYSPRKELLAVAKLSKPLLKNFTKEALVKIKLDF